MQAGRELDALIAEKVMGWKPYFIISYNILYPPGRQGYCDAHPVLFKPFNPDRPYEYDSEHFYDSSQGGLTQPIVPPYSTQIADAWLVVEKIRKDDPFGIGPRFAEEIAIMFDANQDDYYADVYNVLMNLNAEAICLAALKAVGYEE